MKMKNRVFLKCKVNEKVRTLNVTEKTIAGLGDNVVLESKTTLIDSTIMVYRDKNVDIDNKVDNINDIGSSGDLFKGLRTEKGGEEPSKQPGVIEENLKKK